MPTSEELTKDAADVATAWSDSPQPTRQEWWFYGLLQLVDYYESALQRGGTDLAQQTFDRVPAASAQWMTASLASAAEHLAARDGWDPPAWARECPPMHDDWFVDELPAFYASQRQQSPPAFAKRRIYIFANGLERA